MSDIARFVAAWRDPEHSQNRRPQTLYLTNAGSLNETGHDGSFKARSLSPHHLLFRSSLERRIAPLVIALAGANCITYTSCEGHEIDSRLFPAHVGFLDTPNLTQSQIDHIVMSVPPEMQIYRHVLYDTASGRDYATLELYIDLLENEAMVSYGSRVTSVVSNFIERFLGKARA